MAQKTDRRVRRTRKLLHDALIELIMEKGYDSITVQDILDRADVGRSTFYAHFDSKDDLLLGDAPYIHLSIEEILEKEGDVQTLPSFLEMFEHIYEQRNLFRALMGGEGINLVQGAVMDHWQTTLEARFNWLAEQGRPLSLPAPVLANYLTGGLMAILVWWLSEESAYTPEEINDLFMQMAWGTVGERF